MSYSGIGEDNSFLPDDQTIKIATRLPNKNKQKQDEITKENKTQKSANGLNNMISGINEQTNFYNTYQMQENQGYNTNNQISNYDPNNMNSNLQQNFDNQGNPINRIYNPSMAGQNTLGNNLVSAQNISPPQHENFRGNHYENYSNPNQLGQNMQFMESSIPSQPVNHQQNIDSQGNSIPLNSNKFSVGQTSPLKPLEKAMKTSNPPQFPMFQESTIETNYSLNETEQNIPFRQGYFDQTTNNPQGFDNQRNSINLGSKQFTVGQAMPLKQPEKPTIASNSPQFTNLQDFPNLNPSDQNIRYSAENFPPRSANSQQNFPNIGNQISRPFNPLTGGKMLMEQNPISTINPPQSVNNGQENLIRDNTGSSMTSNPSQLSQNFYPPQQNNSHQNINYQEKVANYSNNALIDQNLNYGKEDSKFNSLNHPSFPKNANQNNEIPFLPNNRASVKNVPSSKEYIVNSESGTYNENNENFNKQYLVKGQKALGTENSQSLSGTDLQRNLIYNPNTQENQSSLYTQNYVPKIPVNGGKTSPGNSSQPNIIYGPPQDSRNQSQNNSELNLEMNINKYIPKFLSDINIQFQESPIEGTELESFLFRNYPELRNFNYESFIQLYFDDTLISILYSFVQVLMDRMKIEEILQMLQKNLVGFYNPNNTKEIENNFLKSKKVSANLSLQKLIISMNLKIRLRSMINKSSQNQFDYESFNQYAFKCAEELSRIFDINFVLFYIPLINNQRNNSLFYVDANIPIQKQEFGSNSGKFIHFFIDFPQKCFLNFFKHQLNVGENIRVENINNQEINTEFRKILEEAEFNLSKMPLQFAQNNLFPKFKQLSIQKPNLGLNESNFQDLMNSFNKLVLDKKTKNLDNSKSNCEFCNICKNDCYLIPSPCDPGKRYYLCHEREVIDKKINLFTKNQCDCEFRSQNKFNHYENLKIIQNALQSLVNEDHSNNERTINQFILDKIKEFYKSFVNKMNIIKTNFENIPIIKPREGNVEKPEIKKDIPEIKEIKEKTVVKNDLQSGDRICHFLLQFFL